jgi:hypothetical protein
MSRAQDIDGVSVDELVALADGALPLERRADVEARVARSPRATESLRAQRRALAATRTFAPHAPALRPPRRAPRAALRPALAAACGLLALALVLGLALNRPEGTLAAAVEISTRPAREPPPSGREFAGVTFPDWEREFSWRATGARRDRIDGRATDTVYYQHTHHRIGYTVLSGPAVALPAKGRRVVRDELTIQLYHDGPRTVAVFERAGRTCVLAGVVHRDDTLIRLAAWKHNTVRAAVLSPTGVLADRRRQAGAFSVARD